MPSRNQDGQEITTQVPGTSYTGSTAPDGSSNIVINASSSYVGSMHPCGAYNCFVTTNPDAGSTAPNGSAYVISRTGGYVFTQPQGTRVYT